jgi:hypothetical protein
MGETVLYKRGSSTDVFTLILQGFVNVWSGEDAFHCEMGAWTSLGERVLTEGLYSPDFSAVTSGTCRVLQITRDAYVEARDAVLKAKQDRGLDMRLSKNTRSRQNRDGIGRSSSSEQVRSWLKKLFKKPLCFHSTILVCSSAPNSCSMW